MGYSLNDPNVKTILENIAECLNDEQLFFLKQRLFYVDWCDTPKELEISDYSKEFAGGKNIEMTKISLHDYSELYTVITKCQMKYSPKVLRHLKSDIYELVATNDPKSRLYVSNIDDDTNLDKVDVVIGVGVMGEIGRAGYGSIVKIFDVFEDIIFDNKSFVSEWVVEDALSVLLTHHHGSVPMYKYLKDYEKEYPLKIKEALKKEYDQFLNGTLINARDSNPFMGESIDEIIVKCNVTDLSEIGRTLRELLKVPCELLEIDKLGKFLRDVWNTQPNIFNEAPKSNYRKLIMIYDWLKYAKK